MNYCISGSVNYPMGANMGNNKQLIISMANSLLQIIGNVPVVLWCRGSSGAIMAAIISMNFDDCVINHVKKPGENAHINGSFITHEGRLNIIVDDFIQSGETINAIYTRMIAYKITKVDYLCVFEDVYIWKLTFIPENILSQRVFD